MRPSSLTILLLVVSSGAFAGNPVKRVLSGADSILQKMYYKADYDTSYISRSPGKIGLKLWGNLSGSGFRARGDNVKARLNTDMKATFSLEFDYYDLAIEFATPATTFSGRNTDFEINFNFYPRHFIIDVSYQKAESGAGYTEYRDRTIDVEKGWLASKMLNIDFYYTFNAKHFSSDAPFYQFYRQKLPAGSWLAGVSYQGGSISTTENVDDDIPEMSFKAQHIGIGGGYAYNFVPSRRWLFHLSLLPNIMVWTNNKIEVGGKQIDTQTKFPTVDVVGRAGAVYYFSPRYFIGLYGVGNVLLKRKSNTELFERKWITRLFFGVRI